MDNNQNKNLNQQQREAVEHTKGPLLIIAGAGTGKTTVITERIKYLISAKKVKPQEILALTFTEKAAEEMLSRLDVVMPLGYEEPWIMTFHSFCDRILREEGLEIGLSTDYQILDQPNQWILFKKHLFEFGFEYYLPLSNPTKFIGAVLKFFSRAQDEDINPEDFLKSIKKSKEQESDEKRKLLELVGAYKKFQQIKLKENLLDFGDLILWTLKLFRERPAILKKYQNQFMHILVDEFQDTNWAQLQLIKLLAPAKNQPNLVVVGDDDQCLPGNTKVLLEGQKSKKIRLIKAGEKVLTAVGKGYYSSARVLKVKKTIKRSRLITFKTEDNKILTVTDNHKMFCFVPRRETEKKWHYVYLMHKLESGWRIGTTNDLAQRLRFERQMDRIVAISSYSTLEEALYYETFYSLKYQLPRVCFTERPGLVIKGEWLSKLLKEINTEEQVMILARDLGIDLKAHHFCQGGVTRGKTRRIKIKVFLCYRRYKSKYDKEGFLKKPQVLHLVELETSEQEIINKLKKADISLTKAKKGWRVRQASKDIIKTNQFAQKLEKITGGIIDYQFVVGKLNLITAPAQVMPAGNVLPGNFLPVLAKKGIEYKRVIERKEEIKKQAVYDLEIKRSHNFIAQGIVVHNSIYKWRGAAVSNILDFKKHYPKAKEAVLTRNYRSGQKLLNSSYKLISNNNPDRLEIKLKIDKRLIAERGQKLAAPKVYELETLEDEADFVVGKILEIAGEENYTYKDFAILARANSHLDPFVFSLRRYGLPYQLVGNRGLFDQEEIRDLIFFTKAVVDPTDSRNLFQFLQMSILEIAPQKILSLLAQTKAVRKPLWEIIQTKTEACEKLDFLVTQIQKAQEMIAQKKLTSQILLQFIQETGLVKKLVSEESLENQLKIKNINLFFTKIKKFETENKGAGVVEFVDWLDLLLEAGENPGQAMIEDIDTVSLLTVHAAKGLEFSVVFVVNCVNERFPTRKRGDPIDFPPDLIKESLPEGDSHLEEERRLFYVACTRARDQLFLTYGKNYGGTRPKKPSLFLGELGIQSQTAKTGSQQLSWLLTPQQIQTRPHKVIESRVFLPFISYSQIDTFLTCPLKYKYRYILRIPTRSNAALTFGQTIHQTLRDFHALERRGQPIDSETLLALYEHYFDESGYESEEHKNKTYQKGKVTLKKYFEGLKENLPGLPYHLEKSFRLQIGNIPLIGKIDRIDKVGQRFELIDYKTGAAKKQNQIDKDRQLTIYAMASRWSLGIDPEKLSLYFLEGNLKLSTQRTGEALKEEKEKLTEIIEKIKTSKFEATPGFPSPCSWCDYKQVCPFAKKS